MLTQRKPANDESMLNIPLGNEWKHTCILFFWSFVLSPGGSVFLVYLLWNRHNTHTHTHTHPLPPSTCHYQLADTPGSPATAKKKKKMDCYHGNHMVLSWHGRHRHGNSMVIGQAGQEHTQTHTHTHTLFLDNAVSTKLRPTATLQNNTS